jgi:hypothetical protein
MGKNRLSLECKKSSPDTEWGFKKTNMENKTRHGNMALRLVSNFLIIN